MKLHAGDSTLVYIDANQAGSRHLILGAPKPCPLTSTLLAYHPMHRYRMALAGAVFLASLGAGCRGCAERAETAPPGAPDAGLPRPKFTWKQGLTLESWVIGLRDDTNRYASAVLVRAVMTPDGPHYRECVAVMVAPNLALTAAHCMCVPIDSKALRFDGSQCAKKAKFRAFVFVPPRGNADSSLEITELTGDISIHPGFEMVLDTQGAVVSSRADLATVRLEEAVPPQIQPVRLATRDAKGGNLLIVVGYDYADAAKSFHWTRWFTQPEVDTPVGEDRFLLGPMKYADYKGDTGGPCLRETVLGQELVGISQRGLGRTPTFTRIAPYREWVEEQIRLAGRKP